LPRKSGIVGKIYGTVLATVKLKGNISGEYNGTGSFPGVEAAGAWG